MTPSAITTCARCGVLFAAGAAASGMCPACGQPLDPDTTWHPGPVVPAPGPVAMPSRLPIGWLVLMAVLCAVMGLTLGIWLDWRHDAPARRTEAALPPLPAPGPPPPRSLPATRYYPAPSVPSGAPLPPARVAPPVATRPWPVAGRPVGAYPFPAPTTQAPVTPSPPHSLTPSPLKVEGMATLHIQNPSGATVQITLTGQGSASGVVAPRASVDLVVAPGRYEIALYGAPRTQHFHDVRLIAGDFLPLSYLDSPAERPAAAAGNQ